ncbi:hypothetical protein NDU88_001256 [Pleurodeles waltl]|uniref:Uncharacterized protein n=1 Tax=Pleurodeles waltl TaxID=8319 RepID=A0AAV7S9M1_PLEWA|nr:hypothetical protein NDU88_001256 [Pleurodeles waltl]
MPHQGAQPPAWTRPKVLRAPSPLTRGWQPSCASSPQAPTAGPPRLHACRSPQLPRPQIPRGHGTLRLHAAQGGPTRSHGNLERFSAAAHPS